jgi:hypothetical protein
VHACSPVTRLASHVPGVVKAITKQLKQRSHKARVGSLQLLRELALVLPSAVAAQFNMVVPGIVTALAVTTLHTRSHTHIHAVHFLLHRPCNTHIEACSATPALGLG